MSSDFKQNAVSQTVWQWQKAADAAGHGGGKKDRTLLKAGGQALLMAGVALLLGLRFGHRIAPVLLGCLAAYVVVTALFVRRAYAAFERGVGLIARGVGVALTWILLVPFFYLAFVPGRLVLMMRGKDLMTRKFPSDEPTYWVNWWECDSAHYRKQFR
ncbi:MAG: hypothetical protein BWY59_01195 [Verrucomicrobia bacterium ADurb.Bin345]|nr:MAG: hypothetical protein BWY59_01195 [Verrucomicrobia bacterium ADurb.Bin345]